MKKNLDIVFLLPRFSGGGAERVIINLLTELHNRGYLVGIMVFDKSGPLLSSVPHDVRIYDLCTKSLRSSIVPLLQKIHQLRPKVIFSTFGYINVALLIFRRFLPKKTKIWIREANLPSVSLANNSWPRLMTVLYRFFYRKSDKLICSSIVMKNEFILNFLVTDHLIEVLPNPVDVDKIYASSVPKKCFDKDGVRYVAAGRLVYQKGFDRLLYWFSKLSNKKSTLVILGDGNLKSELIKKSELLDIQDRVKFLGFCDNPWQWYAGADVFLLSSRWEGMPNSVLEALACGTPVIATEESGGIREITRYSKDDSVVVATESQFIHAMNKVKIQDKNIQLSSLLPSRYEKKNVTSIIEIWLSDLP
jgi:glycosyltransferase involved in cell wall biosynthesis